MKLTTFIFPRIRRIFTKLSAVSQSSIKIKVRSIWILLVILLTLAVIYKQRLLHGNEIVQYPQNCKFFSVGQDHFRKPL